MRNAGRTTALALLLGFLAFPSTADRATVSAQSVDLVAAYAFDEGTGSTVQDFSGNGNSGVLVNGATWTAGHAGNAVALDGVASKVSLPSTLDIATLPFTLEAWVRPTNYSSFHVIFSKRNSYAASGMRFDVGLANSTGRVYVTTAGTTVTSTYAPPINGWTHLAVVASATSTELHVNGILQQTLGAITLGSAPGAAVNIGRTGDNDDSFAGDIDDLRLYKRVLTQAEIQVDMGTPVQVPGPHLTITQPAAGSTVAGSTVNVAYVTSGDMTEVNHVHFQLDGNSTVMDLTLDGVYQLSNVLPGGHTLLGYLVRADHSAIPGTDTSVAFSTTVPDVTPPGASSNLAATATGGQVALSWTPATDNVAVTGYRVERCQGAGCSGFAEIGTSTTASYLDGGLIAATSYTYRVRATDAAGLLGPYSSPVSVTTGSVPTGLVAAYGFDEGTGTSTVDGSGNGKVGTLVSGATWATGHIGNAVAFDGVGAKVALPSALDIATLPFTLEAWVRPSNYSDWHVIFSKRNSYAASGMRFDVGLAPSTGRIYVTNASLAVTSTYAPPLNAWTHIAIAADSNSSRLYVNGLLQETLAVAQLGSSSGAAVNIGRTGDNQDAFSGLIDELRLYTRALTASEIQLDMSTPVNVPSGPPDTTPPTVSLTAPAPGATIIGVTDLTATASDNVGVAGVQFLLDGANVGGEVAGPPFTSPWNSATAAPGAHTLAAIARDFSNNKTTSATVSVTVENSANSIGAWSGVANWPIVAVHAALLPTGDVLAVSNYSANGGVQIWRPATNTFTPKPYTAYNLFCMGHTFLADGRLFTAGGTVGTVDDIGPHQSTIFNPVTGAWSSAALMAAGRYYPTTTTLGDGRVLVLGGTTTCASCTADTPEIYDPATNNWTSLASSARMPFKYYPHSHLLPDGRIVVTSQDDQAIATRVLNLTSQTWATVDARVLDGHSSVMYQPGKILKAGTATADNPGHPSAATSYVLDMTQPSPTWQATVPMAFPRAHLNLTVLPDGQVLATGGGTTTTKDDLSIAVYEAELWSPVTKTWTTMAAGQVPRLYHSTALLLPDARVLIAGGGRQQGAANGQQPNPEDQKNAEIYSPPYLFKGPRPVISSVPAVIPYGAAFSVGTPDAARIASVSMIPLAAVTHAFNENQRFVPLAFVAGASSLQVTGPVNGNTAPPGPYMLFVIDSTGVPSVAAMVRLPGPGEVISNTPPTISALPTPQTIQEDTSTGALAITVGDAETTPGSLTLSGTTSNATLVPVGNIVFGGTGAARTLTVTPATNQSGTATVTVTVSDGQATASTNLVLTVAAVNDLPTISSVAPQTTSAGVAVGPLALTIGDVETAANSLTLSGSTSNAALVPVGNIVFGGTGTTRTVTVTPVAGQTGTATLTLTVSDSTATAATSFLFTVTATNTAPTISALPTPQTILEDTSTGALAITVGDAETAPGSLTLSRATSNATLVPVGNIVFGGTGAARTVTVTPAANQSGTATVTVTVSDGQATASTNLALTVTPVNDPPTISTLAPQTTNAGVAVGPFSLTIGDVETAPGSLTLSGATSNAGLVPVGNVVFGGTGTARTVTVTPVAGQTGTATLTLTVSDGTATAATSFLLTVNATPLNLALALGFNEGTGTATMDASGSGNAGTLVNGPTWTTGHSGGAVAFDGVNDQVTLPNTLDIATLPFTLEAWVRPANYSSWHVIFSKRNSYAAAGMRVDVGLDKSTGRVYVTTRQSTVTSMYAPPVNTWTHLAVVADSTSTRLYVNGTLRQTLGVVALGTASGAAVNIGRTGDNDDAFAGAIDDVRLYKRALSLAEIQTDMNTSVP